MSERYTPPECGPTHHLGCVCREANLANEIDALRTRLTAAEGLLDDVLVMGCVDVPALRARIEAHLRGENGR